MYFTLSHNRSDLPFHTQIDDMWLCTSHEPRKYGYKLGECGGNYVNFTEHGIEFSFHKDFKLYKNDDILLTNLKIDGTEVPSDTLYFDYTDRKPIRYVPIITDELWYPSVLARVYEILLENLRACYDLGATKIAYTAGLDSSTLAYITQYHQRMFDCIIDKTYEGRFKNLPFKYIIYEERQARPNDDIDYGEYVRDSFYQHDNLITGFYGDLTVIHNGDMYNQARGLYETDIQLYDPKEQKDYIPFNSREEITNAIYYVNTHTYFRHWFPNFQILDPYRDPRLFEIVCRLNLKDLIEQIGTGKIQKTIIGSLNKEWVENLCDTKNNYDKF
jgi:hypothetical protein